jgi:hypothetical protein
MHKRAAVHAIVLAAILATAAPAAAQRFSFERTFDAGPASTLDVSTVQGTIDVTSGEPGRMLVIGTVTVRVGWNVPSNAVELAQQVASRPPVAAESETVRLGTPSDPSERRAVTVSYEVRVPPGAQVIAHSESGAIIIDGVSGPVVAETQSAAIALLRLGGGAEVTTGSGAVDVDGVEGTLRVKTSSSAITARDVRGGLHARTQSGAIDVMLAGPGDVDVSTSSSAITLAGVSGALATHTQSGRTKVRGFPGEDWSVSAGSGSVELALEGAGGVSLDAVTGSGSVKMSDVVVEGSASKRRIVGDIAGGGPSVRLASRSGSIEIRGSGQR